MKSWLLQKQTALGKDKSNPLTDDSLLKTIWSSIHHLLINEVLTIPGQTTTGKEISNPFMAGVNTPRSDEDMLELIELMVFLLPKVEKVGIIVNVVDLQVFAISNSPLLGVNTPRSDEDMLELMELMVFLLPKVEKVGIIVNVVDLQVSAISFRLLLQALVDKKKVVVTKATIREALRLDDEEGVECLTNEEIFAKLARMGYKKPSTKLTFYKAFFSSQWKSHGVCLLEEPRGTSVACLLPLPVMF
nr:hypothetical protein [Tanacetum cinerariifolium]